MEYVTKENLNIIKQSNEQMLSYFQSVYITKLESLQGLKTESFEIEVKIEELEKTKRLYAFKSNDSKSIFSPLSPNPASENEKSRVIDTQLHDLYGAKAVLAARIATLEQELSSIQEKLELLGKAATAIGTLSMEQVITDKDEGQTEDAFAYNAAEEDTTPHGYNVLMLEEFHNTQMAHMLSHFIKDPLLNNQNKQEVLGWLLNSDLDRCRVTLTEIQNNTDEMLECIDDLINRLQHPIDMKQPIWMTLDDFITKYRDDHPECVIEADIDCPEPDISIPPIIMITFMQALTEIFENIFKHSNANKVTAKIIISNRLIDVFINDNGVGIQSDYLSTSKWYSGLHRLHEAIYLLDGKIKIQGDLISGTNVRFSFPVNQVPMTH
ncbi:MAG: ATP-binding protein [Lachnospiraceae bacterium]|nr:ATP-binding protein [Lachnospiraceae bacterium]